MVLRFDDFCGITIPAAAEEYPRRWVNRVRDNGLQPRVAFTRTLEDRWLVVMCWHHSRVSNGLGRDRRTIEAAKL